MYFDHGFCFLFFKLFHNNFKYTTPQVESYVPEESVVRLVEFLTSAILMVKHKKKSWEQTNKQKSAYIQNLSG